MVTTKMKRTVLIKSLTKRVAELKAERTKALRAYNSAVHDWRAMLSEWIYGHHVSRVTKLKIKHDRHYGGSRWSESKFFEGAPELPQYPSDAQIRRAQAMLRQMQLSHQPVIELDTRTIGLVFGDGQEIDE